MMRGWELEGIMFDRWRNGRRLLVNCGLSKKGRHGQIAGRMVEPQFTLWSVLRFQ